MHKYILFFSLLFGLVACQTPAQKRMRLLEDRVAKLRPLSTFTPQRCEVSAEFTEPAAARYREMYGSSPNALAYTWVAREGSCSVRAHDRSAASLNYQGFLETSFCLLLQTHWVNSPFDELALSEDRLKENDARVQLMTSEDPSLGLLLDWTGFTLETRTRTRGELKATYSNAAGEWLPERLEQDLPSKTKVVLTGFEWSEKRIGKRRELSGFWISAGEKETFKHSHVRVGECRADVTMTRR